MLRDVREQRHQHRADQGSVVASFATRVRPREDRRRGLAAQLLEHAQRIRKGRETPGTRLDVAAYERPVLVERALAAVVLLEGELKLGAGFDLLRQQREACEPEEAQRAVEVRSAYGHALRLRARRA